MKKIALALIATILMTGAVMAQYKTKKMIVPIANRASTVGVPVKVGDFIYIVADSALYMSRVAFGAGGTGTYLTADTSRYAVAKLASGAAALLATTLTVSSNATVGGTLGVTGTTTLSGALNAAGAIGFGTSNNKVTIAAATGNTAIAGTLGVTGVTTIQGQTLTADHVNNLKAGNSLTATDTLFGPVTKASSKFIVGTIPITASTGKVYADSLSTKRIIVSDTLQGLVITNSAGTKYRLRVSPTGVLSIVAVP